MGGRFICENGKRTRGTQLPATAAHPLTAPSSLRRELSQAAGLVLLSWACAGAAQEQRDHGAAPRGTQPGDSRFLPAQGLSLR